MHACTWVTQVILSILFGPIEFGLLGTTWGSLTNMTKATFRVWCAASSEGVSIASSDGSLDTTDGEGMVGSSLGWGVVATMASFWNGATFGISVSLRTGVGTGVPTLASLS